MVSGKNPRKKKEATALFVVAAGDLLPPSSPLARSLSKHVAFSVIFTLHGVLIPCASRLVLVPNAAKLGCIDIY